MEMLWINPDVADKKKVGHNLDPSIGSSLTDMLQRAKLLCGEHLQKPDQQKLKYMGANLSPINTYN